MSHAWHIDPVLREIKPFCLETADVTPHSRLGKDAMKVAAKSEDVPLRHYRIVAAMLKTSDCVEVAPYLVHGDRGGERSMVWVYDSLPQESNVREGPGFKAYGDSPKW